MTRAGSGLARHRDPTEAAGEASVTAGLAMAVPDARLLGAREMLQGNRQAGGPAPVVGGAAAVATLFDLFDTEVGEGAMTSFALSGRRRVIGVHTYTEVLAVVPEDGPGGAA